VTGVAASAPKSCSASAAQPNRSPGKQAVRGSREEVLHRRSLGCGQAERRRPTEARSKTWNPPIPASMAAMNSCVCQLPNPSEARAGPRSAIRFGGSVRRKHPVTPRFEPAAPIGLPYAEPLWPSYQEFPVPSFIAHGTPCRFGQSSEGSKFRGSIGEAPEQGRAASTAEQGSVSGGSVT
jgi:hypothetical protein